MNELKQVFTEMLNHIDDHKQAYNLPEWTNERIVNAWIKNNESKLKKLFISSVSKSLHSEGLKIEWEFVDWAEKATGEAQLIGYGNDGKKYEGTGIMGGGEIVEVTECNVC